MRELVRSDDNLHFGYIINGQFKECTNFCVDLLYCVETNLPTGPGYIARVTRATDQVSGECFFLQRDTKDAPTFTNAIHLSWKNGGGLFCQFLPREMFQLMSKLDGELRQKANYSKQLVEVAGRQPDGVIAINPNLFLDEEGNELANDDHRYVWVPDWPGAPGPLFYRQPARPYSLQPLIEFLQAAETTMLENYPALVLGLGAMVSMLNYKGIHHEIGHFNLPVMYGQPMSGKTLAACCVGLVTGMTKNQISSRNTQAFLAEIFVMSSMPFLWDDPTKETEVRQVCIDLGNAAFRGKYKEDAKIPLTGCLVTANFSLSDIEKYYSRICLIPFKKLDKVQQCGEGPELEKKAAMASASLPELISLSNKLTQADVHQTVQNLRNHGEVIDLRILEGVSVPCFMACKILQVCGLPTDGLMQYCQSILGHHMARQSLPDTDRRLELSTQLEEGLQAALDIDVTSVIKLQGEKLYVRVKEFGELVGMDLRPEMKRRGQPLYKSSSRFVIGGQKVVKKCALIQDVTDKELSLAKELLNLTEAVPEVLQELHNHQPEVHIQQQPEPAEVHIQQQPEPAEVHIQQQPEPAEVHIQQQPEPAEEHIQQQPEPAEVHIQQQPEPAEVHIQQQPEPAEVHIQQQPEPAEEHIQQQPEPAEVHIQQQPEPAEVHIQQQPEPAKVHIQQPNQPQPAPNQPPAMPVPAAVPNQAESQENKKPQRQPSSRQKTSTCVYSVKQLPKKNPTKFVGREIIHEWILDGETHIFNGRVEKTVKGKDGGKRTVYRVSYDNGDIEEIDLYKDFVDGTLKFND